MPSIGGFLSNRTAVLLPPLPPKSWPHLNYLFRLWASFDEEEEEWNGSQPQRRRNRQQLTSNPWIPLVRLVPTFWILLSQLSGTSLEKESYG